MKYRSLKWIVYGMLPWGQLSRMGGSSSKPKVTSRDRAILDLKVQRDRLKQYQKRITNVLTRETEIAKEHLKAGHRDKALLALKKKKYQEQLMEKTSVQLLNLEQMVECIEYPSYRFRWPVSSLLRSRWRSSTA